MSCRLVFLAFWVAFDEVDDAFVHFWPPEVSANELDGFVLVHVSGHLCVVF